MRLFDDAHDLLFLIECKDRCAEQAEHDRNDRDDAETDRGCSQVVALEVLRSAEDRQRGASIFLLK